MKSLAAIVAIVCLAAALGIGIVQLLAGRIAHGDIYPPYSSLRGDPLGTKVLYEALTELLPVGRHLHGLNRLNAEPAGTTLLYLGTPFYQHWLKEDQANLESVPKAGGRLFLAFLPLTETGAEQTAREERARKLEKRFGSKKRRAKDNSTPEPEQDQDDAIINSGTFVHGWGVTMKVRNDELPDPTAEFDLGDGRKHQVPWHSTLYFETNEDKWRVIATADKNPVVIERSFGSGSIVVATDSFFVSNEAMLTHRDPEILSWAIGRSHRVLFEESHLSVRQSPGIVSLARNYRLHGLGVVLLVAMGLFAWRNATSFVPPYKPEHETAGPTLGRDAASGFVNLLRRNLSPRELLNVCVEEWKRSLTREPHPERMKRAEQIASNPQSHPVEAYRTITKILSERKL